MPDMTKVLGRFKNAQQKIEEAREAVYACKTFSAMEEHERERLEHIGLVMSQQNERIDELASERLLSDWKKQA